MREPLFSGESGRVGDERQPGVQALRPPFPHPQEEGGESPGITWPGQVGRGSTETLRGSSWSPWRGDELPGLPWENARGANFEGPLGVQGVVLDPGPHYLLFRPGHDGFQSSNSPSRTCLRIEVSQEQGGGLFLHTHVVGSFFAA